MSIESDFDHPKPMDEPRAHSSHSHQADAHPPADADENALPGLSGEKESSNYGRDLSKQKTVLLIEDDRYVAQDYGGWIKAKKFHVSYAYDVHQALLQAKSFRHFDFVVVDIRMPSGNFAGAFESVVGTKTGVLLAEELVNHLPDATFIALTNSDRADDQAWFEERGFAFHVKREMAPKRFASYLRRRALREKPKVFIVHGHDHKALKELKDYLQDVLKYEEPLVLWERKTGGKTVIEKLEFYAEEAEVVFVLMTPDDYDSKGQGRARQNVVFEYGFFLALRRNSGKVIVLYKPGVEMPSDLGGVIPIDISNGIAAAGEQIKRELSD